MRKSNRGVSKEDEWSLSCSHIVAGSQIDQTERIDVSIHD